jgi:hypothetical protein
LALHDGCTDLPDRYRVALTDWLASAHAGQRQPGPATARQAGDELADRVVSAATAGHVLDFDDTYLTGLAHLSAPTAPVAVLRGAEQGATVGAVLEAYAADGLRGDGHRQLRQPPAAVPRGVASDSGVRRGRGGGHRLGPHWL